MKRYPPSAITRTLLGALALVTSATAANASSVITFAGGSTGVVHLLSDGTTAIPADAGFFFELGAFTPGFDPAANATGDWIANWSAVTDDLGAPLPEATTPFTSFTTIFGDEFDGFNSTVEFDHNDAPFTAGNRGYIWGYDNRAGSGPNEWILITNPSWTYPFNSGLGGFTEIWDIDEDGNTTVVGKLENGSMTLESVGAAPVPEPSTAVLALLATTLAYRRRRTA